MHLSILWSFLAKQIVYFHIIVVNYCRKDKAGEPCVPFAEVAYTDATSKET